MTKLRASLLALRASYWFVPAIMATLAVVLGAAMIWIDARFGHEWIEGLSWYHQVRSDGAREVLSTIAGSMITVAGVVFSITIVALSYASSQYGPRVLTNFMTDRGNTITLGTFIATFLYCLMVLRTIRGGDESFVPQFSVLIAMLLAVCSIGVLIYFIHHVPQSIHINHVVARIGEQLIADTGGRFPTLIGSDPPADGPSIPSAIMEEAKKVESVVTGYIQAVDQDRLLQLARKTDSIIQLLYSPGDFVSAGRVLANVAGANGWDEPNSNALRECFTIARKRSPESDLMFLVSELVEIAARALSPGINDPVTAVTCLDWLGAGGAEFARREMPDAVRADDQGIARVISQPIDFSSFIEGGFGRLRHYVAKDAIASVHMLHVLGELSAACHSASQIELLRGHAVQLIELTGEQIGGADARIVTNAAHRLFARLDQDYGHHK